MKKRSCRQCGKPIPQTGKSGAKRFCNLTCRNRYHYIKNDGAERQRVYLQKKMIEKHGDNLLTCLICERKFRQLGSHVFNAHGMTAIDYRKMFGFDLYETTHTLVPELRKLYGEQAIENGTYKNLEKGEKTRYKKGQKRIGNYERSNETMERLKKGINSKKQT